MASKVETTEVVLRDGSKALVPQQFAETYPGLAPDPEMLELLEENLGSDAEIGVRSFPRVKVPSGDTSSWIMKQGGREVAMKTITGIIVSWSARRSMWINGEPDGSSPDCSSTDAKVPVSGGLFAVDGERGNQNPQGKCGTCPMAQFGSATDGNGGQACKEQRLLYVLPHGALFPVIVHVPRTSIESVVSFMISLLQQSKPYYTVEIVVSLEKAKSKAGQEYNRVVLEEIRQLDVNEVAAVKVYAGQIKDLVRQFNASFDRDSVTENSEGGGYSMGEPESEPASA